MENEVRVRFAPSPTGPLHVGGARTALFNWLFAKKMGGTFILRIEDTDRERYDADSEQQLQSDLKWLGLGWDEGPDIGGEHGPYKQSENLSLYKEIALQLVKEEKAYHCFCTSERLAEVREKQKIAKVSITGYDRHCRNLSKNEVEQKLSDNHSYVIRLKTPLEGTTKFNDLLRGEITYQNEVLDDVILFKSNGFPSYHLANIVDDHNMGITHVLRGEEWIPSTPKHCLIYAALGYQMPTYVHLPVILAEGGKKLSKRKGAASVSDYREKGYLPDTLNNFLALLGWNPGDDLEIMDRNTLISQFSLKKISPKSCFFDDKKLEWMNGQYLQAAPAEELVPDFKKCYQDKDFDLSGFSDEYIIQVIKLLQERCRFVWDFFEIGLYFFKEPESYDAKAAKKRFKKDTPEILELLVNLVGNLEPYNAANLEKAYHEEAVKLGLENAGQLIHPTRLSVTGLAGGPSLFELMELIGKASVVSRLQKALEYLKSKNSEKKSEH